MKLSFLLFAQVACTANAAGAAYTLNNNKEASSEQNSLRGGGEATTDESAHRSLYDVMGLAPGASGCSLHSSNDGTYICGVRSTHFVTDAGQSENHLACVTHPNGSQKCANIRLADGPGFPGAPPPGPPVFSGPSGDYGPDPDGGYFNSGPSGDYGPPPPGVPPPAGVRPDHDGGLLPNQGGGRKCPTIKPTTGTHCCGWIPTDQIEESCYYNNDITQCNCARQDNECNTVGWQCRGIAQSF